MASRWDIKCGRAGCKFERRNIESKADAKRHGAAHTRTCGEEHAVKIDEVKPLSKTVRVGDRIKLKKDAVPQYRAACKAAGWDVDLEKVRVVERIDEFGTGGRPRLFFEGPPFAFYPSDVQLAWSSDDERRKALGL